MEVVNIVDNIRKNYIEPLKDKLCKLDLNDFKSIYYLRWILYQIKKDNFYLYRMITETIFIDYLKKSSHTSKYGCFSDEEEEIFNLSKLISEFGILDETIIDYENNEEMLEIIDEDELIIYIKENIVIIDEEEDKEEEADKDYDFINEQFLYYIFYGNDMDTIYFINELNNYYLIEKLKEQKNDVNLSKFSYAYKIENYYYKLINMSLTSEGIINFTKMKLENNKKLTLGDANENIVIFLNELLQYSQQPAKKILLPMIRDYYGLAKYVVKTKKGNLSQLEHDIIKELETKSLDEFISYLFYKIDALEIITLSVIEKRLYGYNNESITDQKIKNFVEDSIPKKMKKKLGKLKGEN